MSLALVLSIGITALTFALAFGQWPRETPPERIAQTTVVLEEAPRTPAPTPAPTPMPTPRPTATPKPVTTPTPTPQRHVVLAPVQRAAPHAQRHAGAANVVHAPPSAPSVHPRAVAVVSSADGTGSGSGTGPGTGSGGGEGTGGSGTGVVDADAPCGYVEFIPSNAAKIVGDVSYETVRTTVHFPDGHEQSDDFPYPWVYTDYLDTDPWSPINVRKANLVVLAQLPPPGADTRRYPDIVRYVLDHTNAHGGTVLQPCPH